MIFAGIVAGLRGDIEAPQVAHHVPAGDTRPHHADSRYRYCTNFIVTGNGLEGQAFVPPPGGARRLGPGGRRRGHDQGPRPHRRARGRDGAVRGPGRGLAARRRRHARADGRAHGAAPGQPLRRRRGGRGRRRPAHLRGAGRLRRRRRRDLQPLDLRPAGRDPRGPERGGRGAAQQPERADGGRAGGGAVGQADARSCPAPRSRAGWWR